MVSSGGPLTIVGYRLPCYRHRAGDCVQHYCMAVCRYSCTYSCIVVVTTAVAAPVRRSAYAVKYSPSEALASRLGCGTNHHVEPHAGHGV